MHDLYVATAAAAPRAPRRPVSASACGRVDVAVASRFGLSLEGAAVLPLVRPRVVIDPPRRRTAAEASAVGAEAARAAWSLFP